MALSNGGARRGWYVRNAADDQPEERVTLLRPSALSGALVLCADESTRKWREAHESYTVATILPPRDPQLHSEGEIRYRRWSLAVEPGVVAFMEPGEVHSTVRVSGSATFRLLQIAPDVIARAARDLGVPVPVHLRSASTRDPEIYQAFVQLHAAIEAEAPAEVQGYSFVSAIRRWLLAFAERSPGDGMPPLPRREVRRAIEYVRTNYRERITLEALADHTGLTRFRLDQLFSATVGLPPLQYQLALRVAEARVGLEKGHKPGEIAHELGFYDHPQFSRLFKRSIGVSPAQYARLFER